MTAIEGSNLHRERLQKQADDFDPITRDRFLAGALLPGDWYTQASRFRRWYRARLQEVFREVDILLAPATPCIAPAIGQRTLSLPAGEMPIAAIGMFTQPISFAGLPVVATPYADAAPMPVGVQVIAAPWREDLALRVARYLERAGVAASHVAQ